MERSTASGTNGNTGTDAKISAYNMCHFLKENMVDYANEVECMYAVKFFDKDEDGFMTFEEYLNIVVNSIK